MYNTIVIVPLTIKKILKPTNWFIIITINFYTSFTKFIQKSVIYLDQNLFERETGLLSRLMAKLIIYIFFITKRK